MINKTHVIVATIVALGLTGCSGVPDETGTTAPDTQTEAPAEPAPAAEEGAYGSDPELDALWDECEAGSADACDDLYWESPLGSEYESFAQANGGSAPEGEDMARATAELAYSTALDDLPTALTSNPEICAAYESAPADTVEGFLEGFLGGFEALRLTEFVSADQVRQDVAEVFRATCGS